MPGLPICASLVVRHGAPMSPSEHGRMFRGVDPSRVGYRDWAAVLPLCGASVPSIRAGVPIRVFRAWSDVPMSSSEQGRIPRQWSLVIVIEHPLCLPSMVGCLRCLHPSKVGYRD